MNKFSYFECPDCGGLFGSTEIWTTRTGGVREVVGVWDARYYELDDPQDRRRFRRALARWRRRWPQARFCECGLRSKK